MDFCGILSTISILSLVLLCFYDDDYYCYSSGCMLGDFRGIVHATSTT